MVGGRVGDDPDVYPEAGEGREAGAGQGRPLLYKVLPLTNSWALPYRPT